MSPLSIIGATGLERYNLELLSSLPRDNQKAEQLDVLGYGVATQAAPLRQLLMAVRSESDGACSIRFEPYQEGFCPSRDGRA